MSQSYLTGQKITNGVVAQHEADDMEKPMKVLINKLTEKSYSVVMPASVGRDIFYVSTFRDKDPKSNAHDKHGYQRPPDFARYPKIANYYKEELAHSAYVPPILVSLRVTDDSQAKQFFDLLEIGESNKIKDLFGADVASIYDGQHRQGGAVHHLDKNGEDIFLTYIFVTGLDFIREAELFSVINVSQKKLPKALIETNKGDITRTESDDYEQVIRRIAFGLCRDEDSVWGPRDGIEQINMTGQRDPNKQVTLEGLRRSTANMFPRMVLSRLIAIDPELPLLHAKRYWLGVSKACADAWHGQPSMRKVKNEDGEVVEQKIAYRIKDLVGVASLAKLGGDIILTHLERGLPDTIDVFTAKFSAVNWEKSPENEWMRSQAGFAGQKELYECLYNFIYNDEMPY